jgi:hypothetical protein
MGSTHLGHVCLCTYVNCIFVVNARDGKKGMKMCSLLWRMASIAGRRMDGTESRR